jgi:hypothetical protein
MLCLAQGLIRDAWRETSRRSSGPAGSHALAAMRTRYPNSCVQRASRARPCSSRGGRPIGSTRSRPMSSIEWLIADPRCLNTGTTGAAPSPVSLGGIASSGKPLTPDPETGRPKVHGNSRAFRVRHLCPLSAVSVEHASTNLAEADRSAPQSTSPSLAPHHPPPTNAPSPAASWVPDLSLRPCRRQPPAAAV